MIFAIDTNILFDVFLPDPHYGLTSKVLLENCHSRGQMVVCDAVYAELSAYFPSQHILDHNLETLGINFVALTKKTSYRAGQIYKKYRDKKGKKRILADFMIAAHAELHADALVTRDDGFYRGYFPKLKIIS